MTTDQDDVKLRYLEFYAGVGGWRMALEQAVRDYGAYYEQKDGKDHGKNDGNNNNGHKKGDNSSSDARRPSPPEITTHCVGALDHSDLCVSVYEHNFGNPHHRQGCSSNKNNNNKHDRRSKKKPRQPLRTCNIEALSLDDLQTKLPADVYFLSPPCQPHTRQHQNQTQDTNDARSKSFWHFCDLLEQLGGSDSGSGTSSLPRMICVENVVHFEASESCRRFRQVLLKLQYRYAEFHLTPTQVQLPNDRPRYFGVAIQCSSSPPQGSLAGRLLQSYFTSTAATTTNPNETNKQGDDPEPELQIHTSLPELDVWLDNGRHKWPQLQDFLDTTMDHGDLLRVPDKVLQRTAAWCFDIVTPRQSRSSCFTSSYGRLVRGTGSILYMGATKNDGNDNDTAVAAQDNAKEAEKSSIADDSKRDAWQLVAPEDRHFDSNAWMKEVDASQLRYFSGMEMARLFGFAAQFSFPNHTSLKQQWKLMGNSINSRLASRLILLGLIILLQEDSGTDSSP